MERRALLYRRMAVVMAQPEHTLLRIGWETEVGRVQGGTYWRARDGLAPTARDRDTRDTLLDACSHGLAWDDRQPWGVQVLARPVVPSGGPMLLVPPNQRARLLVENVVDRADTWGDLANNTADDLRDALALACAELRDRREHGAGWWHQDGTECVAGHGLDGMCITDGGPVTWPTGRQQ